VVAVPTTVPATTTTTLPTTTTTAAASILPAHPSSGGSLPSTGGPLLQLMLIGVGLAAIGSLLVAAAQRRLNGRRC
jgi:hypothetical protein